MQKRTLSSVFECMVAKFERLHERLLFTLHGRINCQPTSESFALLENAVRKSNKQNGLTALIRCFRHQNRLLRCERLRFQRDDRRSKICAKLPMASSDSLSRRCLLQEHSAAMSPMRGMLHHVRMSVQYWKTMRLVTSADQFANFSTRQFRNHLFQS